ncbi:LssY C-terminal domain-containing protein [Rhodoplanes sp. SY1]|uniref:LssY C-terminal domain-containing protein n=1 Tax=Rhodoplanes sp. SY1 TaxID=3166646 RepID=UPI0038B5272C
MRLLVRLVQRLLVALIGVVTVWLIVFVVFDTADQRLPWIVAVAVTYGLAAYVILPRAVRGGLRILRRTSIPSFTMTVDGLPGDPVNLVLVGTKAQLRAAFAAAGWAEADPLSLASSWRMVRAFVLNRPYPTAPFSTLHLFGRGQDIGFQKPIGDSPRQRHHVRFWALGLDRADVSPTSPEFWLGTPPPPEGDTVLWVGAATRDTGLSFTRLTFQVTHATDDDTNAERDLIVAELSERRVIEDPTFVRAGETVPARRVNHYKADGEITVARLE